jgi:hypothetical protein
MTCFDSEFETTMDVDHVISISATDPTSAEALRKKTEETEKLTNDVKKVQAEKDTLIKAIRNPGAPPSQQIHELKQLQTEVGLMRENAGKQRPACFFAVVLIRVRRELLCATDRWRHTPTDSS